MSIAALAGIVALAGLIERAGEALALGQLALLLLCAALWRRARAEAWPRSRWRAAGALAGAALAAALLAWLGRHACPYGGPSPLQWLIPAAAVGVFLLSVRGALGRLALACGALLLGVGSTIATTELMHTGAFVGGPVSVVHAPELKAHARESLARLGARDDAVYPAGLLIRSPIREAHPDALARVPLTALRAEGRRRWHSPLSGLYPRRDVPVGLRFPGGRLTDGARGLTLVELPPALVRARHYTRRGEPVLEGASP